MSKLVKYTDDLLGWKRKPGPLRVWRVVEGRKKSADGKSLRFSIQEVPEDRFDDAFDLMMTVFMKDEAICNNLILDRLTEASEDPLATEDFRKLWSLCLQQGIVIGAFLMDGNEPKPVLAGVNMTAVACDAMEKTIKTVIEFQSETVLKTLRLMHDFEEKKDVRKFFNVDKVITAFGMCVNPEFRGQGLGFQLLDARNEIAAAYNFRATSTMFTSTFAMNQAAQSGFKVLLERHFADVKNEDGTEEFPGMVHKWVKFLGKKF